MKNEENKNKVLNDIEILLKAYSKKQSENFQKKLNFEIEQSKNIISMFHNDCNKKKSKVF